MRERHNLAARMIAAAAIMVAWPADAASLGGTAYHDRNGNQLFDAGEPALPGVGVSNGRDIVFTDGRGRYELQVTDDTVVFVLKPRGWRTPIDVQQLPRFYYIHKPQGSPPQMYSGVPSTGPLPERVDFPLYPQAEPERFHAIMFGDTQPRDQKEIDYLAHDVFAELVGTDAAFGVTLGDILYDDLSLFGSLNAAVALIGIPWYNVIGNHDLNFDAPNDELSDETFESVYGPPYYSFDYGPVHFIVLDDIRWEGQVTDPHDYPGGNYIGGLDADQLEFVRQDLAAVPAERLVVLMMHIPLTGIWDQPEREQLYRLIEHRRYTFSISAHHHTHDHHFLTREDGWRGPQPHHHMVTVTTCGSWWTGAPDEQGIPHTTMRDGAPNGYAIVTFDGAGYVVDFKAARQPASDQLHIWAPEEVASADAVAAEVWVNVYNGSPRSRVELRFGEHGAWRELERTEAIDPYYQALKDAEEATPPPGRKLPAAEPSQHLWRGSLPAGATPGTHLLFARTTDMWGRTYTSVRSIRIR